MTVQGKNIKEKGSQISKCTACAKDITYRTFIVTHVKPYKVFFSADCEHCGNREGIEDDYPVLDYAVKITCDFTNKSNLEKNIRRMAYIYKTATVTFYTANKEELFVFSDCRSNIDSIEGIWIRGKETLEIDAGMSEKSYADLINKIDNLVKHEGFIMVIEDNSGYSKVAPYGSEYTAIQDAKFEKLNKNDQEVVHEKCEQKERDLKAQ